MFFSSNLVVIFSSRLSVWDLKGGKKEGEDGLALEMDSDHFLEISLGKEQSILQKESRKWKQFSFRLILMPFKESVRSLEVVDLESSCWSKISWPRFMMSIWGQEVFGRSSNAISSFLVFSSRRSNNLEALDLCDFLVKFIILCFELKFYEDCQLKIFSLSFFIAEITLNLSPKSSNF